MHYFWARYPHSVGETGWLMARITQAWAPIRERVIRRCGRNYSRDNLMFCVCNNERWCAHVTACGHRQTHTYTHTHTHKHTHIHTCIHTHIRTHTHTHRCLYICTSTNTHAHTRTLTHTTAHICTAHAHKHTQTHRHTLTHIFQIIYFCGQSDIQTYCAFHVAR